MSFRSFSSNIPWPSFFLDFLNRNHIPLELYQKEPDLPRTIAVNSLYPIPLEELQYELFSSLTLSSFGYQFYSLSSHDPPVSQLKAFHQGQLFSLDMSSAVAVHLLDLRRHDHFLDLCCAPGSKLCLAASLIGNDGTGSVTGVDISRARLNDCRSLVKKYKLPKVRLFLGNALSFQVGVQCSSRLPFHEIPKDYSELLSGSIQNCYHASSNYRSERNILQKKPAYDKILVDAECTHDGSFKHLFLALKNKSFDTLAPYFSLENEARVQSNQLALLYHAWTLLSEKGTLMYCTCSLSKAQNQKIIAVFLREMHEHLRLDDLSTIISRPDLVHIIRIEEDPGGSCLAFDPIKSGTSGFFIARIEYYKKASYFEGDGQIRQALTYYRKAYKLNPELDQDLHQLTLEDDKEIVQLEKRMTLNEPTPGSSLSHEESSRPVEQLKAKRSNDNLSRLPAELILRIFEFSLLSSSLISLVSLSLLNSYYYTLSHEACLWKTIYMTLSRPIRRSDHLKAEHGDPILQEELYTFYEKERQTRAQTYFSSKISLASSSSSPLNDVPSSFNYYRMVQWLPRVRSQGLYICRLIYTRPGQTEGAFNQPIHIVTYYRYLYFHQKSRHVSLLLSNDEPATIVPIFVSYLLQQQSSHSSRAFALDRNISSHRAMDRQTSQALSQLTFGYYLQEGSELFITASPSLKFATSTKAGFSKRQLSLLMIRLRILNHSLPTKHLYHDGAKLQWISFAEKSMETNESVVFDLSIFKSFIYSPVKALNDDV